MVLRDTEVPDLETAALGHEEVVRLHVAMNDPGVVRHLQSATSLDEVVESLGEWHRPLHPLLQALALEQLHADVAVTRVQPDVVETDDVRVLQLTRQL